MTLVEGLEQIRIAAVLAAVPDPGGGEAPPGVSENVLQLLKWIAYLATAACVGGLLYTAAKMAMAHRRGDDTNVSQLGWVFAACILIGSASSIVAALVD
ncbi:hypothetical protein ACGFI4_31390 [Micromonospora carbonacea]|uniref:Conjugal transfer protein TrbC n=1 Tax=Micromonospora haikouensis TaxID=686309 RepID=A0A1C4YPA3_9ACTN|nr:hypothetical protein [Micromonospora haikouensis]SCF22490.1 hypothetical protein GA0070558_1607 [Micromonospora haikouensis]